MDSWLLFIVIALMYWSNDVFEVESTTWILFLDGGRAFAKIVLVRYVYIINVLKKQQILIYKW